MAACYTNTFRLPPSLNVIEGNVSENYKKWKRQVEVYLMASGAVKKDKERQRSANSNNSELCGSPDY